MEYFLEDVSASAAVPGNFVFMDNCQIDALTKVDELKLELDKRAIPNKKWLPCSE